MTTPAVCTACRHFYARHFVVRALCSARWRGASFDAAAARGAIGLAIADVLGVNPRDPEAMQRFLREVSVEALREATDPNPAEPFRPQEQPEWWEFHVALAHEVPDEALERAARAAVEAVNRSRNYSRGERVA